ncbi:hypothetical protein CBR_g26293 [Chara braunii]|uniref:SMP-30/Gluconolactonase/LRE-like region domain-containing protein n=1 Tax=Chara braunii TaxID=69332 RepID=A0A388L7P1_CHABU|nr:hypothetical protein CBR_g26293 [Chara braunii]|eukprot:GBG78262.1 hypothetical protein CBR_g26293 [Chara braunii]
MHILPDLAFLEKKYANKPVVVVGVHSAKFDNEKDLESIRNAVLRYDITHPDVDEILQAALDFYGTKGMLDYTPIPSSLEKEKDVRLIASPLKFPGKLATDLANGRLFISDSNHHRIVVTDLNGEFITQIGGAGGEGLRDGTFEYAAFNRPQGLTYHSGRNVLYVADTENHALREVDFVNEKVTTLAGNGTQGSDYKGGGRGPSQVLNSPWDVVVDEPNGKVYVAMAGQHQIWTYDIDTGVSQRFSGDGSERNLNGRSGNDSSFAQPSGLSLSTDRTVLYVADSESSSIRAVNLQTGGTTLYAGGDPTFADNLFKFGDKDGFGTKVELQHPLGVLQSLDGSIYIADSYNHKIKKMNPSTKEVISVAGNGRAGFKDGKGTSSQCSEPAGLAQGLDGKIFIADTNNNVIRVLDMAENGRIDTLELKSVPLPSPEAPSSPGKRRRRGSTKSRPDTEVVRVATVETTKGQLALKISIPQGYHFTKGATSKYEVDADAEDVIIQPVSGELVTSGFSASASLAFESRGANDSTKTDAAESMTRINCKVYYCQEDDVCLYKALTFEIPFAAATTFPAADSPREAATTIPVMYSIIPKVEPRTQLL